VPTSISKPARTFPNVGTVHVSAEAPTAVIASTSAKTAAGLAMGRLRQSMVQSRYAATWRRAPSARPAHHEGTDEPVTNSPAMRRSSATGTSAMTADSSRRCDPGLKHDRTLTVDDAHTASPLGSGTVEVLGTPAVLALAEGACCDAVAEDLLAEETSVGTWSEVEHLRPSRRRDGVRARDARRAPRTTPRVHRQRRARGETVARVRHRRMLVDRERFLAGTQPRLTCSSHAMSVRTGEPVPPFWWYGPGVAPRDAGDVEVRPPDPVRDEAVQEQRTEDGPGSLPSPTLRRSANVPSTRLPYSSIASGSCHSGSPFATAPRDELGGERVVVRHHPTDEVPERDDDRAGERRDVDDGVRTELDGVRETVAEDEASLRVGVHDLDGRAVAHADDVADALRVTGDHVLGEASTAVTATGSSSSAAARTTAAAVAAPAMSIFIVSWPDGRLERVAAGVERDALADERDVTRRTLRLPAQLDEARLHARSATDAEDPAVAAGLELAESSSTVRDVVIGHPATTVSASSGGTLVLRRRVDEVAHPHHGCPSTCATGCGSPRRGGPRAGDGAPRGSPSTCGASSRSRRPTCSRLPTAT
jgi:fluoroacetyl-CoA thioesterase